MTQSDKPHPNEDRILDIYGAHSKYELACKLDQALLRIKELEAENEKLKEYKFMYESVSK